MVRSMMRFTSLSLFFGSYALETAYIKFQVSPLRRHHMRYGLGISQHYPTLGFGGVQLMLNVLKLTNLVQGLISIILLGIS